MHDRRDADADTGDGHQADQQGRAPRPRWDLDGDGRQLPDRDLTEPLANVCRKGREPNRPIFWPLRPAIEGKGGHWQDGRHDAFLTGMAGSFARGAEMIA